MSLHRVLLEKLNAALEPRADISSTRRDARLPAVPGKVHAITGMRRAGKTTFMYQLLEERRRSIEPERAVYLSFDDNFQSWHRALPLLDTLGVKATFYVNSLPIRDRAEPAVISDYFDRIRHKGDRIPLSSEELLALADHGHAIGCHTRWCPAQ